MPRLTRKASKRAKKNRMHEEMHKFKHGSLRSSSGKKVTSRAQAIAIGLSESGQSKRHAGKVRGRAHSYSRKHHRRKRAVKR